MLAFNRWRILFWTFIAGLPLELIGSLLFLAGEDSVDAGFWSLIAVPIPLGFGAALTCRGPDALIWAFSLTMLVSLLGLALMGTERLVVMSLTFHWMLLGALGGIIAGTFVRRRFTEPS